jgi:hypothetical protein
MKTKIKSKVKMSQKKVTLFLPELSILNLSILSLISLTFKKMWSFDFVFKLTYHTFTILLSFNQNKHHTTKSSL